MFGPGVVAVHLSYVLRFFVADHGPPLEAHGPVGLVRAPEVEVDAPSSCALDGVALAVPVYSCVEIKLARLRSVDDGAFADLTG